jgi:hypothetical protein
MSRAAWAVALWLFCTLMGALARYAMVVLFEVWTPDGRLAVDPPVFTLISVVPLAVTGALFVALSRIDRR